MTAPMVDYKIHWLKMMSVPESRAVVGRHDGINGRDTAWKLAPRDTFIEWTPQLREKNLPFVVDNPRFLILPWITIPNLGSHILATVRRRLPEDWAERYNTTPVLIETFVQTPRFPQRPFTTPAHPGHHGLAERLPARRRPLLPGPHYDDRHAL